MNKNKLETGQGFIRKWEEKQLYKAEENKNNKKYILIEFPYPSGERLHVGHARSYCCLDAVARWLRMKGSNVLFPFGWDAFGLPAENYAIKTGVHPSVTTRENIDNSSKQAKDWGLSFDWSREINTTDPGYYKWTQWIFVQMFKKGLAYKAEIPVNWCPSCKINQANEEVIDGKCERCGTPVTRRNQSQWLLAITKYADRLLDGLKTVNYRSDIAAQQVNWIGRKEGAQIRFKILTQSTLREQNSNDKYLEAFTTRIDTLFGVTFVVIAPEVADTLAEMVPESRKEEVKEYIRAALNKSERERKQKKENTGVDTGLVAENPADGKKIPVWVAEYVMTDVGAGVVMGVPAHDARDLEFARTFKLPVIPVIEAGRSGELYEGEGKLVNSGRYNGMDSILARRQMTKDGLGKSSVTYHLRDWVFSRQHYWGEPIPMIECKKCGWVPVPENQLPVKLPEVEKYLPTDTGESPLAHIEEWVNTTCPNCGGPAERETDTMPNWAGSSWYFLRFCDPHNDNQLADKKKLKYWLPVDLYNGGMEHTTLHLLYSRFWHKFLFDIGVVPIPEPFDKRTSHGVILGSDNRKMSKSRGNVINPDEIVSKYGADTLRMYEMFIGPFEQTVVWSIESLEGVYRFLKRIRVLAEGTGHKSGSEEAGSKLAELAVRIGRDLEVMKFNTAVAAMMEFANWWGEHKAEMGIDEARDFIKILAPMAPFMAEELWQRLNGESDKKMFVSVHQQGWPESTVVRDFNITVTLAVQVNGKVRALMESHKADEEERVREKALQLENVRKYTEGKKCKVIFVPGKVINFVISDD